MKESRVKIKQFSKAVSVHDYNIRFYENSGLKIGARAENGYREYSLNDAFMINRFNMLLSEGFSISSALEMMNPDSNSQYCAGLEENIANMERELKLMERRIAFMKRMKYIYENFDAEFEKEKIIELPELLFIDSASNFLKNGKANVRADIIALLPVVWYAKLLYGDGTYDFGELIRTEDAVEYGIDTAGMFRIPASRYRCRLTFTTPEVLPDGSVSRERPAIKAFTMVPEERTGEIPNYLLIPIEEE